MEEYKKKLVDYFKRNLAKGYTSDSLKFALVRQGYARVIVDDALIQANKELAETAPILHDKPVIKYEVIDEHNKPIVFKKPFWKRIFRL